MIVVVYTNIIFSALLTKGNRIARHLTSNKNSFVTPSFLFYEVFNHKERIIASSKLDVNEFEEHFLLLFNNIDIINIDKVTTRSYYLAHKALKEIDEMDIPFLALAIELKAQIWTGDKSFGNAIEDFKIVKLYEPEY
jgi:predicted nucleic acid-binding protein